MISLKSSSSLEGLSTVSCSLQSSKSRISRHVGSTAESKQVASKNFIKAKIAYKFAAVKGSMKKMAKLREGES